MKKHEADAIVRFLDFAEKTMTQSNFMTLLINVEAANDDMTDEQHQYVYYSAFNRWQKQLKKLREEADLNAV